MASSGNFASINFQAQSTISTVTANESNLTFNGSSLSPSNYEGGVVCNFGMTGGKWYWETYLHGGGTPNNGRDWNVGFAPYSTASKSIDEGTYGLFLGNGSSSTLSGYGYTQYPSGTMGIRHNNSTSSFGSAHSSGDILGHALDLDNGTYIIYKNGSSLGTAATGIDTSLTYFASVGAQGGNVSSFDITCNFGQDSTFKGAVSAGGNADGNGFGDFKYSVPSNYLACCSGNLTISDDIDPAQTDDNYPGKQCAAVTFTGNGGTNNITGVGFQADLAMFKNRGTANSWIVVDSSRGGTGSGTKALNTNGTGAESTGAYTTWNGFASDGFNLSGGGTGTINQSSASMYGMLWRANGGTTASNSDGDVTSTVQSNTKAGFSIVEYVGNRSSAGTSTVGHGLGGVPDVFMLKPTSHAGRWYVWHTGLSGASYMLELNGTSAEQDKSGNGSMSLPTSTVFDINYTEGSGENGETHIGYFWRSIEGYSKFGSYVGNGNADGPFIYTGFRPSIIWLKSIQTADDWVVQDTARSTYNPSSVRLVWNLGNAEHTSNTELDFLSNGFKPRTSNSNLNKNNTTYIYGSFADVPWKYNNTF